MTGEQRLKAFTEANYQKTLTKVNDHIYHFLAYGISNSIAIIGDTSVILVDALDSPGYAEDLKKDLQEITDKPVETIIYTHGHPDHRGGAGVFRDTVKEVIAFAPENEMMKYYDRLQKILIQRGGDQFGYDLTDEECISEGIGIREGRAVGKGAPDILAPTTIYQEKEVERVIDGVRLKMVRAVGETDDQIFIWLEDDKVICTGDNYYGCWPNLYAIRGTQYRDIATWIDSLGVTLSYEAEVLLPGHTKPLFGRERILDQVGTFRDAIEYVLLNTLECMNQGMSMSETAERVKLPQKYLEKDYLGEFYGTVEWSVKGIYCGYVGWFDGNPVNLFPVSDREYQAVLRELIGREKLEEKIQSCVEMEQYQMALQLLELVDWEHTKKEQPDGESRRLWTELKKKALLGRARQVASANGRHYLIAGAKKLD